MMVPLTLDVHPKDSFLARRPAFPQGASGEKPLRFSQPLISKSKNADRAEAENEWLKRRVEQLENRLEEVIPW
jgi:hypothetical protein